MSNESPQVLYCYAHPQRETLLRCNRCNQPMCTSCAVRTPTGYRCKECVRGQQKIFETAQWWDFPVAVVAAGVLSYIGSLIVGSLGFFTFFLSPVAGMIIAEVVRWLLKRRRSKYLPWIVGGATLLGGLASPLFSLILLIALAPQGVLGGLLGVVWPALYAVLAASTAYFRLKGIRL